MAPENPDPATWPSVARDAVRGAYNTVWQLIDRERLGIALTFFILAILGAVALVLALKLPSNDVGPVLQALLDLVGRQWAVVALSVSLLGNIYQAWNRRQLSVIMQREIDRQATEKRELQVLLVPQLEGRTSRTNPVLKRSPEQPDDD